MAICYSGLGGKQIEAVLLETHTLRLNVGGDDDKDVKNDHGSDDDVNAFFPRLHHKKIGEISGES